MKIKLNDIELAKIKNMIEIKNQNMSAANLYVDYLTDHRADISKKDINFFIKEQHVNLEKAFYFSFLKTMGIDPRRNPNYQIINKNCNIFKMKQLYEKSYQENEFLKNIKIPEIKDDNWEICNLKYLPFEGLVYDEIQIDNDYREFTPIGFFDKEVNYPAVIENDTIWMSVTPHEINTMKESIKNAKGNVLVYGLGIGYYAYMISLKNDVQSITIIDNDSHAIKLFQTYILPQFPYKDKIRIILDDAFKYYDNSDLTLYDYTFFDIYHNVGDGIELYLKMKAREHTKENLIYTYWIETSLLDMMRRQLLILFEEELDGAKDDLYTKADNINDIIINKMHFVLKDYPINTYQELHYLLSDDQLKELAKKLDLR
jgi:hypothetical protein